MFMCTKEDEAKTTIKLSLLEQNVVKLEQGEGHNTARHVEVIPLALPSATTRAPPSPPHDEERASPKSENEYTVQQLFRAIYEGRVADVRHCLRYVEVRARDPRDGKTVLMAAVAAADPPRRRLRLMRLLVDRGAVLDATDPYHERDAIAWAAAAGRTAELGLLLDLRDGDVDYDRRDARGASYLHLAVAGGCLEAVELLLARMRRMQLSADAVDSLGLTPYITARRLGLTDIASALRRHGDASIRRCDDLTFRTPREWSILGRRERRADAGAAGRRRRMARVAEADAAVTASAPDLIRVIPPTPVPSPSPSGGEPARSTLHRCLAIWSEQHLPTWRPPAVALAVAGPKGVLRGHRQKQRLAVPARRVRMR